MSSWTRYVIVCVVLHVCSQDFVFAEPCNNRTGLICSSDCSSVEYCSEPTAESFPVKDCSETEFLCDPQSFDCTADTCGSASNPDLFVCPSTGFFPDFYNCSKIYLCTGGTSPSDVCTCPADSFFNTTTSTCEPSVGDCERDPPVCSGDIVCDWWDGPYSFICITEGTTQYPVILPCTTINTANCVCEDEEPTVITTGSTMLRFWEKEPPNVVAVNCSAYTGPTISPPNSAGTTPSTISSDPTSTTDTDTTTPDSTSTDTPTDTTMDSTSTDTPTDTTTDFTSTDTPTDTTMDSTSTDTPTETTTADTPTETTTDGPTPEPPICTSAGDLFPDETDCRFYWICVTDTQAERRQCIPIDDSYFDESTNSCQFGDCTTAK